MRRFFIFLVISLILPGLLLFSGDSAKSKVKKIKGAKTYSVKGFTRSWKDVRKVPLNQRPGPRKMKPIMNFQNPKQIKQSSTAVDPVVQNSFDQSTQGLIQGGALAPDPSIDFAGMNFSQNGAGWPPDTCGDVGINHYVQAVNTSIGIYNKSTGAQISTVTFDDFFEGPEVQGTPCDENNNGDPIVLYDRYAQRWVILDFAWIGTTSGSWYSIAASKTSDPTGDWWLYAFHCDNTLMNDYPKAGVWDDGIYITANMFQFGGYFQHSKIWALNKTDLYNGTLTAQSIVDNSWEAWSILPTHAKGSTAPAAGDPNYMYALDADEYGPPGQDAIHWWKFFVDWNTPANTLWDGPYTMLTAPYTLTASGIPQPGTSYTLDSLYGRLMNPAIYRNFGSHGSVYLNHVCDVSGKRVERWYEVRINSGSSSIYQQGTYAPDTHHRWMGSIAGDKWGNIALGYSVASTSLYPSIRYTGRFSTDPLGELSQGEASIIEGGGSQVGISRWGDYSSMSIDPVDDETFWYTQEYYSTIGSNWQTRIAAFKLAEDQPEPPIAPSHLTATLTNENYVSLSWQDNSDDEDLFIVYRGSRNVISTSANFYRAIAKVRPNVTTWVDRTVLPNTGYYYKVCAVNENGEGCSSPTKIKTN
jgi:hypothetical protein